MQRKRPSKWSLQFGNFRKDTRKRPTSRDVYWHWFSDENVTSPRERRWSSIGLRQSPLRHAIAASPHENRIDSPDFTSKPLRSLQKLCPTGSRSSGVCGPKLPSGTHVLSRYLHWNRRMSSAKWESMRSQALRASSWASLGEHSSFWTLASAWIWMVRWTSSSTMARTSMTQKVGSQVESLLPLVWRVACCHLRTSS
jgi:hypothetical protein